MDQCCNDKCRYSHIQTLAEGGWTSYFFPWEKSTFPISFVLLQTSCKITSANDILSKDKMQNTSSKVRAHYQKKKNQPKFKLSSILKASTDSKSYFQSIFSVVFISGSDIEVFSLTF